MCATSPLYVQSTVLCVCIGGREGHILLSVEDLLLVYSKPCNKTVSACVLQMCRQHKKNGLSAGLLHARGIYSMPVPGQAAEGRGEEMGGS